MADLLIHESHGEGLVTVVPAASIHRGSFSSFVEGDKSAAFFRSISSTLNEEYKWTEFRMKVIPKHQLDKAEEFSAQKPSNGKNRDMANAAGFWVVCESLSSYKNRSLKEYLNGTLDETVRPFEDEYGMKISPDVKLEDCMVSESKHSRAFLDIQARPVYQVSPKKGAQTLAELQDDEIQDALQLAINVAANASTKDSTREEESSTTDLADQSSKEDKFNEIILQNVKNERLSLEIAQDASEFQAIWNSNKTYTILKNNSPLVRSNKENEQNIPMKDGSEKSKQTADPKTETQRIPLSGDQKAGKNNGSVRRLPQRQTGTCKWFNTIKGYGFILPEEGNDDIFVHQTAIKAIGFRSLAEGEKVEFDVEVDENGRKKARNVTGPNGDYVRGAPFVPPYMGSRGRGNPYNRGYGRGGWSRGHGGRGGSDGMRGYSAGGHSGGGGYQGYGRGRRGGGAGRMDFRGNNGQVDGYGQRNQYYGAYTGYGAEYGPGNYQQMGYGGFGTGNQGYMVPQSAIQQRATNMMAQQMQGLSLGQIGMGVSRSGMNPSNLGGGQQGMYQLPPTMMGQAVTLDPDSKQTHSL
mmetsp:Transcript_29104/g.70991  ORF Transcript_29104/g.70991 Transcript_29104/m.70991 type:complete len:579 (+) Transcript_29104:301-2037(+)